MAARVTIERRSPPDDPQGDADDALVEGILDEALDGFDDLPPDLMRAIRDSLGDVLAAHPSGQRLLRQLKTDPVVAKSSDQAIDGDGLAPSDASKKASG